MKEPAARTLVLDSQALSLLLHNDRQMVTRIEAARRVGVPVLVSALTVVEAVYGKTEEIPSSTIPPRGRTKGPTSTCRAPLTCTFAISATWRYVTRYTLKRNSTTSPSCMT